MRRYLVLLAAMLATFGAAAGDLHDIVTKGSTDRSVTVDIMDSTDGTPEVGVVFNTAGIDLWYRREGAASVDVTEATLAALTTAHTDGGFLHVNDGTYRLDLPDAAFATGANYFDFGGTVTGMIVMGGRVRLTDANLEDATRLGLAALPNAAAAAAGGLFTRGTGAGQINQASNGTVDVNVVNNAGTAITASAGRQEVNLSHWLGTAAATPTTAGVPEVDVTHWHSSDLLTGTGPLAGLGVLDRGTAQADGTTTIRLRDAVTFADDELIGTTGLVYSATTGAGQRWLTSDNANTNDLVTFQTALVTDPTGTVRYELYGTAAAAGASLTATDVWAHGTRTLTAATNITSTGGTIPITSSRVDASVGAYQSGLAPLQPTVAARTLDVTATGGAGIDWANVESPTTSLTLSGTTVGTATALGTGAVNTTSVATGAIDADAVAADAGTEIGTATWATTTRLLTAGTNIVLAKGTGVTGFNDLSGAQVNTEVDTAIADVRLDELVNADSDIDGAAPPAVGSVFHELMSATTGSFTFDQTTDANEALRNNVGTAGAGLTAADDAVLAAIAALNDPSVTEIWQAIVEDQDGGHEARCVLAALLAYVGGTLATTAGDSTYEDPSGTETRIQGTVTSPGNRASMTITCPSY